MSVLDTTYEMMASEQPLPNIWDKVPDHVKAMQPYKPGKPLEELKEEFGLDRVIKLASNENPFGCSPKAVEAAIASISGTYRYPDPVSRRLRRKLAEQFGINPFEIAIGAGSENLIAIAIRTFLATGDTAVTGYGAFLGFDIHSQALGVNLAKAPSPNYKFDVQAILDTVNSTPCKVVYIPNPNNPTGTYLTNAEAQTLINGIPSDVVIIWDEAYLEFCGHLNDYPDSLKIRRDNMVVMRTFSKAYGLAGLRIAYAVGHPAIIEQMMKVKMTFEPAIPAQEAALAALDDHEFLQKTVDSNRIELQRYYQVLDELKLTYVPSSGNFILVELFDADKVTRLNDALLQKGIAIRPAGAFGFPTCARISIGAPDENDSLFAALRDIVPTL